MKCFGRGRWIAIGVLVLLAACSSQPSTLYARPACGTGGDRASLLDGEIKMVTHWSASADEVPDVRAVVSEQGRLSCYIEDRRGRREGRVSEADWRALWARLDPVSPWSQTPATVKPNDPTGGPYHVVTLRAGNQVSQFSSQHRSEIISLSGRDTSERLGYTNLIVEFVACRAKTPVEIAPPPSQAPAAPAGEPRKP